MCVLVHVAVVKQTMITLDCTNIIVDHLNHCMVSGIRNGNGVVVQEKVPCPLTQIVLHWFQEHNTEFQLTSCSPNLTHHNPKDQNSGVIQWQHTELKITHFGILDIHDRA